MGAVGYCVRIRLRRNVASIALTALAVGILGGATLGIAAGARRTDSAPDRLTRAAGGDPDLQVTQMKGTPLIDNVGKLPGVKSVEGFAFVLAFPLSPKDQKPLVDLNPFTGDDDAMGAHVVDGRFTHPSTPDEFTVNRQLFEELSKQFDTKVGDQLQFVAYSRQQIATEVDFEKTSPAVGPFPATLVGITASPSDFDETSSQLVFSNSFLESHPEVGVVQTLMTIRLDSEAESRTVLDQIRRLPDGEDAYAEPVRIVSDSSRRAVRFQVFALVFVSALACVAAVVVTILLAGQCLRLTDDERRSLTSLGWRRSELGAERAIEGAVVGLVAAPIAALIALLVSAAFPLGILSGFEPSPGLRFDALVTGTGVLALVFVASLIGATVGWGRRNPGHNAHVATAPLASRFGMSVEVGTRFATVTPRGRRRWTSTAGVLGVAGLVAAAYVGVALTSIVQDQNRWGINFDALYGNPYTPSEVDIVTPLLDVPELESVTGANIGNLTVNGADISTFAFDSVKGDLRPSVIRGRDPLRLGEIALGAEVARQLGVDVGDQVNVRGLTDTVVRSEVVGLVVTPDSAGNGAAVTFDAFKALNPDATRNVVIVRLVEGAPSSTTDDIGALLYSPPDALPTPVSIKALERVTAAPFLLCAVFALMLLVSGAYLLNATVRARSLEFAVLRALGSVRSQLRAIVHWLATVVNVGMVVLGVPLGVVFGRLVVGAVVTTLGIVPNDDVPLYLLVVLAIALAVIANLVAVVPARRATHISKGVLSRSPRPTP